jgi:hypothetical protein
MKEVRDKTPVACARFHSELAAFLEGEARPFVTAHAQSCRACEAVLAEVHALRLAARALPEEEPSPVLWTKLRTQLAAEGMIAAPACRRFDAELEAHLEGAASEFVLAHALSCAACGALLADLEAIPRAARALPQDAPSPAVWAQVRATLKAEGAFRLAPCAQFDETLPEYLEGAALPFIPAHAQDCTRCGALLADLQAIHQAAQELPIEEPSRVVWANVRAQLEAAGAFRERGSGWRQITAWARLFPHIVPAGVLAMLMIIGSVLTLPSPNVARWGSADEATPSSSLSQVALSLPVGDRPLARIVSELESSFHTQEASMAPDLKATYEKSLVSLDGSIRECLDSLQHEPGNTLAHDYLLTAYTRKAEVLSSALEFEGR